jgi:hypothetical protein
LGNGLTGSLVSAEEEELVFQDGAADSATEDILVEGCWTISAWPAELNVFWKKLFVFRALSR